MLILIHAIYTCPQRMALTATSSTCTVMESCMMEPTWQPNVSDNTRTPHPPLDYY